MPDTYDLNLLISKPVSSTSLKFRFFKAGLDIGLALITMPLIAMCALILLAVNPFLNPGPVFFLQDRMGRDMQPFRMWKFRTMRPAPKTLRNPDDPVESHRIPPIGRLMRRTRIDELPNFINVLRGEMSVVGPRPDAVDHAVHYSARVKGYALRHRVRPGITGLAQVEMGYAEGTEATALKVHYDSIYVARFCGRLDLYIIRRTLGVMLRGFGAK